MSHTYWRAVSEQINDHTDIDRKWFWGKLLDKLKNKSGELSNKLQLTEDVTDEHDVTSEHVTAAAAGSGSLDDYNVRVIDTAASTMTSQVSAGTNLPSSYFQKQMQ